MDPIDNLAQSLLVGLVICSAMSDGYIMIRNMFHDQKTLENMEYCQDLLKAVSSYGLDKYKKEEDGSIIVADEIKEKEKNETENMEKDEKEKNEIKNVEKEEENIKMKINPIQTPWEMKGMTKEEYESYKLRKKKERSEMENKEHKSVKKEKDKNKSFPSHK